jgi:hypothetical protein
LKTASSTAAKVVDPKTSLVDAGKYEYVDVNVTAFDVDGFDTGADPTAPPVVSTTPGRSAANGTSKATRRPSRRCRIVSPLMVDPLG